MTNRTTPTNPLPVSSRPPSLNSPRTSLVKRHSLASPDTNPGNINPGSRSPDTKSRQSTSRQRSRKTVALGDSLLQFFGAENPVGRPFADLARHIVDTLPRNPERTVALRKLLEAKDCAIRASLYVMPDRGG